VLVEVGATNRKQTSTIVIAEIVRRRGRMIAFAPHRVGVEPSIAIAAKHSPGLVGKRDPVVA
jgi:hypothetical protein